MKLRVILRCALWGLFETAVRGVVLAAAVDCEFRFNPAGDSDLIPATIPI